MSNESKRGKDGAEELKGEAKQEDAKDANKSYIEQATDFVKKKLDEEGEKNK